jgi:hypothetical protein
MVKTANVRPVRKYFLETNALAYFARESKKKKKKFYTLWTPEACAANFFKALIYSSLW